MRGPEAAQGGECEGRHGNEAVLVALGLSDMHLLVLGIDIVDPEVQGFADTQPHGKGGEDKDLVADLAGGVDESQNLGAGEQRWHHVLLGRLYQIEPLPVFAEDMVVEEL